MAILARGTLTERPMSLVFGSLARRGFTGELLLHAGGKDHRIGWQDGAVVAAEGNHPADSAVKLGITVGIITSTQAGEVSQTLAAHPERDELEVLGAVAGLADDVLTRLARRVVGARAARALAPVDGEFVVTDEAPGQARILPIDARWILFTGIRHHFTVDRLEREVLSLASAVRLRADHDLGGFGFGAAEEEVLGQLQHGELMLAPVPRDLDVQTALTVALSLIATGEAEIARGPVPRPAASEPRPAPAEVRPPPPTAPALRPPSTSQVVRAPAPAPSQAVRSEPRVPSVTTPPAAAPRSEPRVPPVTTTPPPSTTQPMLSRTTTGPVISRTTTGPAPSRTSTGPVPTTTGPVVSRPAGSAPAPMVSRTATPMNLPPMVARTYTPGGSPMMSRAPTPMGNPFPAAGTPTFTSQRPTPHPGQPVPRKRLPLADDAPAIRELIAERVALLDHQADHYTLLGIDRHADANAIRAAYFELARLLHPDRLAALGIPDDDRGAQRLFARINDAFTVLSTTARRVEYDAVLDAGGVKAVAEREAAATAAMATAVEAEERYRLGEMAMRRQQADIAVHEFQRAVDLKPDEPDYMALLGWALYVSARDKVAAVTVARAHLHKAMQMKKETALPYLYLGRILRMEGEDDEASRAFRRALEIAPGNSEAQAELRVVEARRRSRPSSRGGLFSRLGKKP